MRPGDRGPRAGYEGHGSGNPKTHLFKVKQQEKDYLLLPCRLAVWKSVIIYYTLVSVLLKEVFRIKRHKTKSN